MREGHRANALLVELLLVILFGNLSLLLSFSPSMVRIRIVMLLWLTSRCGNLWVSVLSLLLVLVSLSISTSF